MTKRLESIWVYLGEIIAAGLLRAALDLLLGLRTIASWLVREQPNLSNLVIVGVAATAIALGAFVAILTTDFGMALRRFGEAKTYLVAFAFPLLLFVTTLSLVSLGNLEWGTLYIETSVFFLAYSTLNLFTMVKNLIDLVGLWQDYDRARKDGKRPTDVG